MIRIDTEFAGLNFKNPYILASGPPTLNGALISRAFERGWAGAVTKTLKSPSLRSKWLSREPQPMLAPFRFQGRLIGMQNIATAGSSNRLEDWQAQIPAVKSEYPDCMVIGSVAAELDEDEWKWLVKGISYAAVDAIELDVSCSHSSAQHVERRLIGESSELTGRVIRWSREVTGKPLIVKLPAFGFDIREMVRTCYVAGASAISGINTLPSLLGVDIETLEPRLPVNGRTTYGGLSGPVVKPIALRTVSLIAKENCLPISGIGGISSWRDAVEFFLFGAGTVQICTAVMWQGFDLIEKLVSGLQNYMERKNFDSLSQLIGRANSLVVPQIPDLTIEGGVAAQILTERCTNCGLCAIACRDSGYQAIVEHEGRYHILATQCEGCGLCMTICPTTAIKMLPTGQTL